MCRAIDSQSLEARPSAAKSKPRPSLREVTVDDVIKDLLDLFGHLGLDAGRLAARVVNLDAATIASGRLYPHASAIGELLTAWHQDPEYLDALGSPSPIRMRAARRSFRHLADKTVPNMDANTLLLELEKIGAVTIDANRYIHVHTRSLRVATGLLWFALRWRQTLKAGAKAESRIQNESFALIPAP